MLDQLKTEDILFLDIETAPQEATFDQLTEQMALLWEKKSSFFRKEGESPAEVYERAGIYAEFGKVICISVGFVHRKNGQTTLRMKSFFHEEEIHILTAFSEMLQARRSRSNPWVFCAHNGKEFDYPYLSRRFIINQLPLPKELDLAGKKPWDIPHLDTMELWKFGDYKHYTSLNLLTTIMGIPTPKNDIDGSMVCRVYWQDRELERIVRYCEKDVVAIARLFQRLRGETIVSDEEVHSTTWD